MKCCHKNFTSSSHELDINSSAYPFRWKIIFHQEQTATTGGMEWKLVEKRLCGNYWIYHFTLCTSLVACIELSSLPCRCVEGFANKRKKYLVRLVENEEMRIVLTKKCFMIGKETGRVRKTKDKLLLMIQMFQRRMKKIFIYVISKNGFYCNILVFITHIS